MRSIVGLSPERRGAAALQLATMLSGELVVCAVVPVPWPPSPARVDAEYRAHLEGLANDALERARGRLPDATFVIRQARSVPAGLLELAEERDAEMIVAGSSSTGPLGHVSLGSVTSRLMHSSPVPVALAPRGFRCPPGGRVERVTVAYGGEGDLVRPPIAGTALRIASFAVRPRPPYTSGVGREADDAMVAEWEREIRSAIPDVDAEVAIGHGENWPEAMEDIEWREGDVLVVGSSAVGPVARVFLGSRASKLVRHSPVPVVIVPREAR